MIYLVLWLVVPAEPLGSAWQRGRGSPDPCGTSGLGSPRGQWVAHCEGKEREVMAEPRRVERLTASDLFMLVWDDYGWPNQIGGLAILDGTGLLDRDGHLRIEAVRGHIEPRLAAVPRFRQLLCRPRRGLGWPLWVDAPCFDLADHIGVHPLTAPAQLLQACEELARRRLDPARPLWELWLLPGLPERRVGAFIKVHHVVADGPAGVAAFGAAGPWRRGARPGRSAVDADTDPLGQGAAGRQPAPAPAGTRSRVVGPNPSGPGRCAGPERPGRRGGRFSPSSAPPGPASTDRSAPTGGLRQLLARRGEDVQGLVLRAMVPISLHQEQAGQAHGNQPGWMMVPLPLGEPDPVRRLALIGAETATRRHQSRPQAGSGIFRFVAAQRA